MYHKRSLRRRIVVSLFIFIAFLSICPIPAYSAPVHIRILHVNDFHGYAEPYKPTGAGKLLGGVAYLAGRVDDLRADKQVPTILVAAGDMIQGHPWTNVNRGKAVIELMNLMKLDAMVIGNHELDFGQAILKERIDQASFPVLGANVTGIAGLKPYVIKTVGSVRVGILGVVTEDTPYFTHPDNVGGLTFTSPAAACERYLDEVKRQSDVVILLSHTGFAGDKVLAEKFPGLDAVIGGHSHTKVDRPVVVGKTVIVQAWEHAKALGVLDIVMEDGKVKEIKGHLEEIRPAGGHADRAVAELVARYAGELSGTMKVVFGRACSDLDGESIRFRETNLGDMIADVMREATFADVALINAGSIRTSIPKGSISMKDVYSVLPFDNHALVLKLKGKTILQALEHGVAKAKEGPGAFLQVSGLQFSYSLSDPPGRRVKGVKISGRVLDPDHEYRVALNDFMAAGGDGYDLLKDLAGPAGGDNGQPIRDLVIGHIRLRGEVCPQVEGRIIRVGQSE
ncbi:MAG: bifunctional UDP-sugar hydrolase/5'-nucleotidase [Syntrophales bacterium]|nr:bifunctional UDP-sugar hydrolase/5'-nucleotidase [Syntrophales bacterium]